MNAPSNAYSIDDIRYYVAAFGEFGIDIRHLCNDYESVTQPNAAALDQLLEEQLNLDVEHQKTYWLWIDGALEAIGMMESDGILSNTNQTFTSESWQTAKQKQKNTAFISKVRSRVERVKGSLRNAPIMFEAVPNTEAHAEAVTYLNYYTQEIFNQNRFLRQKEHYLHDGVTFGSGVLYNSRIARQGQTDLIRFEEKIRQGSALSYQEFLDFQRHQHRFVLEHVDTFELIRPRTIYGALSDTITAYPYLHRLEQKRLSELEHNYPQLKGKVTEHLSPRFTQSQPDGYHYRDHHGTATLKRTYIHFPVRYDLTIPVQLGPGILEQQTLPIQRMAMAWIDRIDGHGIVDMKIDEFNHNQIPFDIWIHTPSSKHACGIGLVKYGRDAQRIHTIMTNGKLRYFERMMKGGGFFMKGLMDQGILNQKTKEQAWVEIDMAKLPAELRQRPMQDMILETKPTTFPSVYNDLLVQAELSMDDAMAVPDASRGVQQGSSGRQEAILANQAEIVLSSGTVALEHSYHNMGIKLHSNILQFEKDPFNFQTEDGITQEKRTISFNQREPIIGLNEQGEDQLIEVPIGPQLQSLEFSTQVATRSIVPSNPTERRFFYQDLMQRILPYITGGKRELIALQQLNFLGFGGVPGVKGMVDQLLSALEEDRAHEQSQLQAQAEAQKRKEQFDNQMRIAELKNDQMRLNQKYNVDMTKIREENKRLRAPSNEQPTQTQQQQPT